MKLHLCGVFSTPFHQMLFCILLLTFVFKQLFCTRNSRNVQARRLLQSGKNEHPQPPTHAPRPNPVQKKPKTNERLHKPEHHQHKMHAPSPSPFSSPPKALPSPSASAPPISFSGSHHPLAAPSPSPSISPPHKHSSRKYSLVAAGGAVFVVMAAASVMYCRVKKVGTVRPWATGLSGQLQRAFVTGNFFLFCVHSLCFSISV